MTDRTYEFIGAAFDKASHIPGCADAPDGLRKCGLMHRVKWLGKQGIAGIDGGNVASPDGDAYPATVQFCEDLNLRLEQSYAQGHTPVVIGGDHSISMGSVSAAAAFLRKAKGPSARLGLIWVDAHPDLETPQSTSSGNLHGTAAAHLLGFGDDDLAGIGGFSPKVLPGDLVYIALRDTSLAERTLIRENGITAFTMTDVVRHGIGNICEKALKAMDAVDGFVVTFDMDAIDPAEAPAVQAPERGGLLFREARALMELVSASPKLMSVEIVELLPALDEGEMTQRAAISLIAAAIGRQIV